VSHVPLDDLPREEASENHSLTHERIRTEVFEIVRARENVTAREVGILRLAAAIADDADCTEPFVAWARLASRWNVRGALAVFGVARDGGGIYAITEWPGGGTLETRLATSPLTETQWAHLRDALAATLADARDHGVAHGRIVPSEILLAADGSARLAAFGIGLPDDESGTLLVDDTAAPVQRLPVSAAEDARRLAALGRPKHSKTRLESESTATHSAADRDDAATASHDFPWRPLAEQYRVEGMLGAGGMGSVHRALELATGRVVAIKRMKNAEPSAIKRFRREASSIARLNHPHVLQLMQAARDDEGDYLVLECAPNGSLADRLKKDGKLPLAEVLAIARKIGAALEYAHGKGCIHRDVKPHNILLSESNEPKLADFGLARALDDATLTTSSAGAGSPVYMPPEQWQDGRRVDARADVYAFAKTLYHLLTGDKPASIDRRAVPADLHAVLKRATEQEAEDRYDSVAEFVAAFERACGAMTTPARTATRSPTRIAAMLVVVALATLAIVYRERIEAMLRGASAPPAESETLDPEPIPVPEPIAKTKEVVPPPSFDSFVGRALRDWNDAAAAIRAASHYHGLDLRPQADLVPLRIDSVSRLLECAHTSSGDSPAFQGSGRYALTDATAIVLVLVPGATFEMGAQSSDAKNSNFDPQARADEEPLARVELAPYFLGKYEVTQAQWLRLAGKNPSQSRPGAIEGANFTLLHPVENVSYADALATLSRSGLTLPTEAQWELACRAGTATPWFCGKDAAVLERYANLADTRTHQLNPNLFGDRPLAPFADAHANTAPIHAHAANPYGFHDMAGNVAEWCLDSHGSYAVAPREGDGARIGESTANRAVRGGSYFFGPEDARSAARSKAAPDLTRGFLGIRVARRLDR
jgi:serine/threonine protein kinase